MNLTPAERVALTIGRVQAARNDLDPDLAVTLALALIREHDAQPASGAVLHLLTGDLPDGIYSAEQGDPATGRLLVTVYPSGSGEVAYRSTDDTRERWGVPSPLSPAP